MKDLLFKKIYIVFGLCGTPLFYVHSAFSVDDVKWLHSVSYCAYFYSLWLLPKHNSEYKILIQYHIVWLLVVIFSQRATREAMKDFPSDKKRRKKWEDACGRIKLPKDPLLFLSTLALMPLSLLVDHSYWKSLQTRKRYKQETLDAVRMETLDDFLSTDLTLSETFRLLVGNKTHGTAFGLNL